VRGEGRSTDEEAGLLDRVDGWKAVTAAAPAATAAAAMPMGNFISISFSSLGVAVSFYGYRSSQFFPVTACVSMEHGRER